MGTDLKERSKPTEDKEIIFDFLWVLRRIILIFFFCAEESFFDFSCMKEEHF